MERGGKEERVRDKEAEREREIETVQSKDNKILYYILVYIHVL